MIILAKNKLSNMEQNMDRIPNEDELGQIKSEDVLNI